LIIRRLQAARTSEKRACSRSSKKNRGIGGHIDNTGIYELFRRRCRLIISIDGEADADFNGASLIQVERFARIDLNVIIRMNWTPIGTRTLAASDEIRKKALKADSGRTSPSA
jgi:hypothetical protein